MPQGVNHAACGTDGNKLYSFGGRGGDNVPSVGYSNVQVYDPQAQSWTTDSNSNIPRLPQRRGGMGNAVYAGGEFYVIGGETTDNSGDSNGVYSRVDVYSPTQKRWRSYSDIPQGKHGIFPVLVNGKIWIAGGGVQEASSSSKSVFYSNTVGQGPVVTTTPTTTSTKKPVTTTTSKKSRKPKTTTTTTTTKKTRKPKTTTTTTTTTATKKKTFAPVQH